MTDAAIISGSLVDVRNVHGNKSVKLSIEIPAELAPRVFAAFGWPTMAEPVSVAIARLNKKEVMPSETVRPTGQLRISGDEPQRSSATQPQRTMSPSAGADKPRKTQGQIAGYLCTLGSFQRFLRKHYEITWSNSWRDTNSISMEEIAAECVRNLCKVRSRADLTESNTEWLSLQLAYKAWEREAEVVPA